MTRRLLRSLAAGSALLLLASATTLPWTTPTLAQTSKPSGADEVYDAVSIQQLVQIVNFVRLISEGTSNLIAAVQGQEDALEGIRQAHTGTKDFPLFNGPAELDERQGGPGLDIMTEDALNSSSTLPPEIMDALDSYRDAFSLQKAFDMRDSPTYSKRMNARLTARGAIAAASADMSYRRTNSSMERIDEYVRALETSDDLKKSIDINTRVMIEVAQQINESMRVNATLSSVVGQYLVVVGTDMAENDGK